MPKMKTNRGAAKRFSFTATGKVKRGRAYHRHILEKKSPGQKRRLRSTAIASAPDTVHIKRMLPYK